MTKYEYEIVLVIRNTYLVYDDRVVCRQICISSTQFDMFLHFKNE